MAAQVRSSVTDARGGEAPPAPKAIGPAIWRAWALGEAGLWIELFTSQFYDPIWRVPADPMS